MPAMTLQSHGDELLTINEVARTLKVSPRSVWNWIDDGRLQSVRVGPKLIRVRASDLDAFVEAGSEAAS